MLTILALVLAIAFAAWTYAAMHKPRTVNMEAHGAEVRLGDQLSVGIAVASSLDFELRPESFFDRMAKAFGLSVEFQVGRDAFDQRWYLVSDDRKVMQLLRSTPDLRDALQSLGQASWPGPRRFYGLRLRQGRLELLMKGKGFPSDQLLAQLAEKVRALAALLPVEAAPRPRRDPVFVRTTVIAAIAVGMFMFAVLEVILQVRRGLPQTLDSLFGQTTLAAAGVFGLFLLATLAFIGRTSRAHLLMFPLLLFGGVGALVGSGMVVAELNRSLDPGAASIHSVRVVEKGTRRSRRAGRGFVLKVEHPTRGLITLRVNRREYQRWSPPQAAQLYVHPGYFGARWVSRIEPQPAP